MKFAICLLTVLSSLTLRSFSQKIHKLSFTDGKLNLPVTRQFETVKQGDSIQISFTDKSLSQGAKDTIKEALIQKVNRTIRNLKDTKLGLSELFGTIWGSSFYRQFLLELESLKSDLINNSFGEKSYVYFPDGSSIKELLNPKVLFEVSDNKKAKKDNDVAIERRVLYRDPYKNWLIQLYNNDRDIKEISAVQQDNEYIDGWRDLEAIYKDLKSTTDSIRKLINYSIDCDFSKWDAIVYKNYSDNLGNNGTNSKNKVIKVLNMGFFKRWLWYTEGIPVTNPFFSTTLDKEYPLTEETIFFDSLITIKITDSLNKLQTKKLQDATLTRNTIKLPLTSEDFKSRLWHYDASSNYNTYELSKRKKYLTADEQVYVAIHNVPKEKKLSYSENVAAIPEYGSTVADLNNAVGETGKFISSMTSVAGPLGSLLSLFERVPSGIPLTKIPLTKELADAKQTVFLSDNVGGDIKRFGAELLAQGVDVDASVKKTTADKKPFNYIEKAGYIYYLSNDWKIDKPLVLNRYMEYYSRKLPDSTIKFFLLQNKNNNVVNYFSETELEMSIDRLIDDFEIFYNKLAICNKQYLVTLADLSRRVKLVSQVISLPTRNLPPAKLESKVSDTSQMRTEVSKMTTESDKQISFSLTEVTEGSTKDSLLVYKDVVKFGKWSSFDVSAGIGFTFSDYTNNTLKDRNKVTEVENKNARFHGIAGLHWYPAKIYKRESSFIFNSWRTLSHRVSVFAGIDIINPTFNFYPGVSFDLIPGFKLIMGPQLYRNTKYEIVNNTVVNATSGLRSAGLFSAIHIDSKAFTKIFTNK